MLADGNGERSSDTRISLQRIGIFDSVQSAFATDPKIAIEGSPQARPYVVAQVTLEGECRGLLLRIPRWRELISRKKVSIRREEPNRPITVNQPMSPSPRQA